MNATTGSEKGFRQVKENKFFMDFVRVTGILPALFWTRPKIYYAGNKKKSLVKGGVLIASNHVTFRDPLLLFCVFWRRRLRFLATKDLYKNRLITLLFSAMGHIQVDKDNVRMDTLHQAVDCLKEGDALLIFPEGQVNQQQKDTLGFKSGAVLMAHLAGVPIQPVFLVCPEKARRRHIAIVGEPIDVCSMCSRFPSVEEMQKVSDCVRNRELALEQYYIDNIQEKKER